MEDKKTPAKPLDGQPCAMREWNDSKQEYVWHKPAVYCPEKDCDSCGWNHEEAYRRAQIPLTLCADGLYRKLIPPKPKQGTGEESSVEDAKDRQEAES